MTVSMHQCIAWNVVRVPRVHILLHFHTFAVLCVSGFWSALTGHWLPHSYRDLPSGGPEDNRWWCRVLHWPRRRGKDNQTNRGTVWLFQLHIYIAWRHTIRVSFRGEGPLVTFCFSKFFRLYLQHNMHVFCPSKYLLSFCPVIHCLNIPLMIVCIILW